VFFCLLETFNIIGDQNETLSKLILIETCLYFCGRFFNFGFILCGCFEGLDQVQTFFRTNLRRLSKMFLNHGPNAMKAHVCPYTNRNSTSTKLQLNLISIQTIISTSTQYHWDIKATQTQSSFTWKDNFVTANKHQTILTCLEAATIDEKTYIESLREEKT